MASVPLLRRPQPPDRATARALHYLLNQHDGRLLCQDGGYVRVDVRSGLWLLELNQPTGGTTEGLIDPAELLNWLEMYGVTGAALVGLFDEYPPGEGNVISTMQM
jgi:hypothetical protein